MLKTVRKRPTHNTHFGARKGVIYLPRAFIGTMIKVMTEGQYKRQMATIKSLKHKINIIRELTRYEIIFDGRIK